ncbi:transcriptional regulator, XRE family with cupin sensor [Duganella sp. CF517]|uniref:helix-turn-helix domain-containing protein n=1 Tax=Duganella sp. CF517 TaxID=1881038 RepID=UPI0008D41974|nr:XRE family transcriptional regulator [Duganella sp. CF517]SEN15014.1 transcriptional regulator, XRE family with cupin sensor [Duganella sp. CF517]
MDINLLIARRVRELRDAHSLSLDALAARSTVSRSTISSIERGESSPTAAVLDKLASALGVALASLFEDKSAPAQQPSPVARVDQQPVWTDPASGYTRRSLSPPAPSPIQLVDVIFPPGQRVAYDSTPHGADIHQQIWIIGGTMDIGVGEQQWRLHAGDTLVMRLERHIVYFNPTAERARYLVALTSQPATRRN